MIIKILKTKHLFQHTYFDSQNYAFNLYFTRLNLESNIKINTILLSFNCGYGIEVQTIINKISFIIFAFNFKDKNVLNITSNTYTHCTRAHSYVH